MEILEFIIEAFGELIFELVASSYTNIVDIVYTFFSSRSRRFNIMFWSVAAAALTAVFVILYVTNGTPSADPASLLSV